MQQDTCASSGCSKLTCALGLLQTLLRGLVLLSLLLLTTLQVQHVLLQLGDAAAQDAPAGQVVRNQSLCSSPSGSFDLLLQPLLCHQHLQTSRWDASMQVSQQHTILLLEGHRETGSVQADSLFSVGVHAPRGTPIPQLLTSHLQADGAALVGGCRHWHAGCLYTDADGQAWSVASSAGQHMLLWPVITVATQTPLQAHVVNARLLHVTCGHARSAGLLQLQHVAAKGIQVCLQGLQHSAAILEVVTQPGQLLSLRGAKH